MARMRDRLDAPVLIGVGAAFDFHAGLIPQAPPLMQRCGLEWLYRLAPGAAPAVAALPALQPALRAGLRAPVLRGTRTLSGRALPSDADDAKDRARLAHRRRAARGCARAAPRARRRLRRQPRDRLARAGDDAGCSPARADGAILERHWPATGWTRLDVARRRRDLRPGRRRRTAARSTSSSAARTARSTRTRFRRRQLAAAGARSAAYATPRRRRPPAAAAAYLDLVVRGGDNQIYHQSYVPGAGWSGCGRDRRHPDHGAGDQLAARRDPQHLGRAAPTARCTRSPGPARGWTDWSTLGGGIVGAPTSVSRAENVIDVYVRGADDAIYQRALDRRGGWTGLVPARLHAGRLLARGRRRPGRRASGLFARGGATALLYKEWNAARAGRAWTDMGPDRGAAARAAAAGAAAAARRRGRPRDRRRAARPPAGKLRVSVAIRKPQGPEPSRA